jgi:hypothetical protein
MWPLTKNAKGGDLSETDTRLTQNDPEETLIDTIISVRNSALAAFAAGSYNVRFGC